MAWFSSHSLCKYDVSEGGGGGEGSSNTDFCWQGGGWGTKKAQNTLTSYLNSPLQPFKREGGVRGYLQFVYQARAKRGPQQGSRAKLGLLTNQEDTIPGTVDSIGTPKMYILEKTQFRDLNILASVFDWLQKLR